MERPQTEGVFFLDPDNRSYLEGSRPWYHVVGGNAPVGCSLIFLFVVPLVGVPFLWYLITTQLKWRSFRQNAIAVSARIVELKEEPVGDDSVGYKFRYLFEVEEGERIYERQPPLSEHEFKRLQGRQTVEVIYPRGDPSSSRMLSEVPGADWGVPEFGFLVCGGVLPILLPVLAVLYERERRRRLTGGRVLRGEVVTCTGAYDDDRDFLVTLTGRFRTPQGGAVELTRRVQRNDLSPERLPAPGTAVLARYTPLPPGTSALLRQLNDRAAAVL
jgi:hypothetical protein